MSPLFGIEAIAGLIPINLHLQKLSRRSQLQVHSLSNSYIFHFLMEPKANASTKLHLLSLGFLTKCQHELIKESVVDIDNCFNKVFPFFNSLNPEFSPGCRIIDIFSSCFLFHLFNKHNNNNFKS